MNDVFHAQTKKINIPFCLSCSATSYLAAKPVYQLLFLFEFFLPLHLSFLTEQISDTATLIHSEYLTPVVMIKGFFVTLGRIK